MSMCKFITHFNIWCTRCCNFSIVNRCRCTIDFVDDGVVAAVNDGDGDDDNCDAVDKFVVVLAIVVDNFFVDDTDDTVCMAFDMFGIVVVVAVAVAATAAVAGVIVAFVIISGVIFSYCYYF